MAMSTVDSKHSAIAWFFIGLIVIGITLRSIWQLYPYKVMTINKPIEIITANPISGVGDIEYVLDYCKRASYDKSRATVQHSFIDGVISNTPISAGPLPSGCHVVVISIPSPTIPPGDYVLEMRREYIVNPVRAIEVTSRSKKFRIYANSCCKPE